MMRVKRTLALAVFGLALVLGGHAAVSAAPLFEAREQIANVANRGHHVHKKHHVRRHYNRHYKRYHGRYPGYSRHYGRYGYSRHYGFYGYYGHHRRY